LPTAHFIASTAAITDITQTDHFEIAVIATSRTIDVRKLSL
jgi:hypothetical protein